VDNARHQWEEIPLLRRLAGRERQSSDRPSMESADETDEKLFASMPFRKFDSRLNCLGPAVAKVDFLLKVSGGNLHELPGQVYYFVIVKVRVGIVQKTVALILYG
jgi:hypothetical protein